MLIRTISVGILAIVSEEMSPTEPAVVSYIFGLLASTTPLCILGSRIFFNLKEAAERGITVGTNWASYSQSTIDFAEPMGEEAR